MTQNTFYIGPHLIGGDHIFVIAEIGNNHNGSINLAKKLVDEAIKSGADCAKFQIRNKKALYRAKADGSISEDLGVEYIQDLLNKVELTLDEHREVRAYCKAKGITYMCTPWDEPSVDVLATLDVSALKIASADLCNPYLIKKAAQLGKPLVLSTGMSFEHEIVLAIKQLNTLGVPYSLLHCNSTYPAPEGDIQLKYIPRLQELHPIIGYSGHERGTAISIAAVAVGAKIIERHITLDREMEGPDHLASLEPQEFKSMVDGIRQLEKALPCGSWRQDHRASYHP
jgi:N-acetylneuraminate synthase